MNIITSILPPILIFLGVCIIFQTFVKKSMRKSEKEKKEFIENEREASFSRVKNIEQSRYIKINIEDLPIISQQEAITTEEKYAYKLQQSLLSKIDKPMGHFEESNIDLKRMYGVSNLEVIIQMEENYTQFLHKLNEWAKALVDAKRKKEAIKVLEQGILIGLDFTQSFILLSDLYKEFDDTESLKKLYELTKQHKNITMNKVISHIEDLL